MEVDRPDRKTRRAKGTSDPIDACAAAIAALSGRASGTPKTRDGRSEAIRPLRGPRRGAGQGPRPGGAPAPAPLMAGSAELRQQLRGLNRADSSTPAPGCVLPATWANRAQASKAALPRLARRHVARPPPHLRPGNGASYVGGRLTIQESTTLEFTVVARWPPP